MRSESLLIAAVLASAAAACANGGGTTREATFEAVMESVVTPRCTFASSCHASPALAAALDLSANAACDMLINRPSCLFPDRMRVVPGNPEDSFFFHKLTGQGLHETPTGAECASESTTNLIMPYGAKPLDDRELALVHDWIAAGAECTNMGPGPIGPAAPKIEGFTADRSTPLAGEAIRLTVTLDRPAPEGGQRIFIETDTSVLAAPLQVMVPASEQSVSFDSFALRPTSRFTVTARAGDSSRQIKLRIPGIEIAEVMANPLGPDDQLQWIKLRNRTALPLDLGGYQLRAGENDYDLVIVQLTGTIPARGCVLIGGPGRSPENGEPSYTQEVDFAPDLPHSRPQAAGYAVFDRNADPVDGVETPVDTLLVGVHNNAQLLGPDAEVASPHCAAPMPSTSAVRSSEGGPCVQAPMQPSTCF